MNNSISKIRALTLVVIFIVVSLLLLRFIIEFSATNQNSIVASILLFPTSPIGIFFRSIKIFNIEISTIFAIIFLIILGYIISKILTALESNDPDSKSLEIIEAIIRFIEFLIILRALLKFIGADAMNSPFAGLIYFLTGWAGIIIKPLDLTFGLLDLSALIVLLSVILLDINTEVILRAMKFIKTGSAKSVEFVSTQAIKASSKFQAIKKEESKSEELPPTEPEVESRAQTLKLQPSASETPSTAQAQQPSPVTVPIVVVPPIAPAAGNSSESSTALTHPTIVVQVPTTSDGKSPTPVVLPVNTNIPQPEPKAQGVKKQKKEPPKLKHKDDKTAPEG